MNLFADQRWPRWIQQQLVRRGIQDERVLDAFTAVPRAEFVAAHQSEYAENDAPLPIGCGQTVSQPYVVARSLEALALSGHEKVLDIGTGSGYQAVLLSYLAGEVYTIEIFQELYISARLTIERLRKHPVHTRQGDGSLGWPEAAPFDAIVGGACAPSVPQALLDQLAPGGRMVLPVGDSSQVLTCFTKQPDGGIAKAYLDSVVFVPLLGKQGTGRMPS